MESMATSIAGNLEDRLGCRPRLPGCHWPLVPRLQRAAAGAAAPRPRGGAVLQHCGLSVSGATAWEMGFYHGKVMNN